MVTLTTFGGPGTYSSEGFASVVVPPFEVNVVQTGDILSLNANGPIIGPTGEIRVRWFRNQTEVTAAENLETLNWTTSGGDGDWYALVRSGLQVVQTPVLTVSVQAGLVVTPIGTYGTDLGAGAFFASGDIFKNDIPIGPLAADEYIAIFGRFVAEGTATPEPVMSLGGAAATSLWFRSDYSTNRNSNSGLWKCKPVVETGQLLLNMADTTTARGMVMRLFKVKGDFVLFDSAVAAGLDNVNPRVNALDTVEGGALFGLAVSSTELNTNPGTWSGGGVTQIAAPSAPQSNEIRWTNSGSKVVKAYFAEDLATDAATDLSVTYTPGHNWESSQMVSIGPAGA